jgi:enoyl-CoA hydratase/carnithine racemase
MTVHVRDEGAVRVLTMDRPEVLNAFDSPQYDRLSAALGDASDDDAVSVVVLTGEGRAFTTGQDLREMATLGNPGAAAASEGGGLGHGFMRFMDTLVAFDKPLLAAVNGMGVGLGLTVLAHCDLVVVGESARLKAPFTELGVAPEAASSLLFPQLLGWQRASWLLYSSEWIDADTAVAWGLAFKKVADAELQAETLALASVLAGKPLVSLKATKAAMVGARSDAVAAARAREDDLFKVLTGAGANADALAAFLGDGAADGS